MRNGKERMGVSVRSVRMRGRREGYEGEEERKRVKVRRIE